MNSLLCTVPDSHGILFVRLVLLALAIAALGVYGRTLSLYNTRVVPQGALTPTDHTPLIVNAVTLVPASLSIIWAVVHLALLARRLVQSKQQRRDGGGEGGQSGGSGCKTTRRREVWSGGRPVVYPAVVIAIDSICWVFFVAMAVLSGIKANQWKEGLVPVGGRGVTQVDLNACPSTTTAAATGLLDYWCEGAWGDVVGLTNSGTSILGTMAGVHASRALFAAYELYLYLSYRRRHPSDEDTTAGDPQQQAQVELDQK